MCNLRALKVSAPAVTTIFRDVAIFTMSVFLRIKRELQLKK